MENVQVICTTVLETGSGFGARTDTGQSVFIPKSITTVLGMAPHMVVDATLIPNSLRPDKTPWFCVNATPCGDAVPTSFRSDRSIDDRILTYLQDQTMYATSSEVAEAVDLPPAEVSGIMVKLFRQGRIAKADVYSAPGQQSPSFCLWAQSAARFIEEASA
jgi:hypothetical protein